MLLRNSTSRAVVRPLALAASLALSSLAATACGGSSVDGGALPSGDDSGSTTPPDAVDASSTDASVAPPATDASKPPPPASDASQPPPPANDAALPPDPTDGPPTHLACTTGYGNALSKSYGRLDGYIAATECGAVDTHVHVQVRMNNQQYDVAINLDTLYAEMDAAMPDSPWSEGWHTGLSTNYPQTYGLHSSAFIQPAPTQQASMNLLAAKIESEIANANHISIYATGYGPDGIHDVHRKVGGSDGVIVIHPLSKPAHMMMFRFSTDSF
jgi:hypothetical protein